MCLFTKFNSLAKAHVCFHQASSRTFLYVVQVPKLSLNLTLAMAAVVALFAAFLVDHRVAAALGTQVPGDAHMAQAHQSGGIFAVTVAVILAVG